MINKIGVIDYRVNNIFSVTKALQKIGASFGIIRDVKDLRHFSHFILPGVGSFAEGSYNLDKTGLKEGIRGVVAEGAYFLGICLGMQLIFDSSEESDNISATGLSLISGTCKLLPRFPDEKICIPHIGWNSIDIRRPINLLKDIPNRSDFYFMHSYHVVPDEDNVITAYCSHGIEFAAVVEYHNIMGTQFHLEKSFPFGFDILKRFCTL